MRIFRQAFSGIKLLPKLYILGFLSCLITFSFVDYKRPSVLPAGDPDNGGLFLPGNFEALVVSEGIGRARHIAVNDNGDIYVKLRSSRPGEGGNVAIRDTNKDGKADIIQKFGDYDNSGSLSVGMRIHDGYLYFSSTRVVYRNKLMPGKLVPESKMEVMLTDDQGRGPQDWHIAKPMAFDDKGNMYVPFGAPSNGCQIIISDLAIDRSLAGNPGAPGENPCSELTHHAGIWKFSTNKIGQTQKDGIRISTGIRSVVGIQWNKTDKKLYAVVHGRDNLTTIFPQLYSAWQNAVLPAEMFVQVKEGSDYGWPYYYYDPVNKKYLMSPEYGGDGKNPGKGASLTQPIMSFPAHWAPNDLLFYQGDQFPEHYKNGAFIAFHGSNNRAPYPQAGYFVCFVPFKNGVPAGKWEVFADGFAKIDPIINPTDATYQPMGLAMGPDGSLYVADSHKGKIWRIMYKGDKRKFGDAQLASMEKRKTLSHIRTPDEVNDNLDRNKPMVAGLNVYNTYCRSCHQQSGKGDGSRYPSLVGSEGVKGDKIKLINVVLTGSVRMPQHSFLTNQSIAEVLTYIRENFGDNASAVTPTEVNQARGLNNKK